MVKYYLIFCLCCVNVCFAQKENIIVKTTSGEEIKAKDFSAKRKYFKIKTLDGEKIELDYKDFDLVRYTLEHGKDVDTVIKQYIPIKENQKKLLKRLVGGKCSVFEDVVGAGMHVNGLNLNLYFIKANEEIAYKYTKSVGFIVSGKRNSEREFWEFFGDCPEAKRKFKELISKQDFIDFVNSYNKNCG